MNNPLLVGAIFIPLLCAALGLLIAPWRRIQHYLALGGTLASWVCSISLLVTTFQEGIQVYQLGGWQPPYGIVLVADKLSAFFAVMASSVVAAGVLYAMGSTEKCVQYPAFMPLLLCMGAGLTGALYTGDIFTLFVFVELMVASSVSLVAISDNRLGLEAAIKYLFISAMGTLFLLIAIGALYATFGTLNIADIAQKLSTGDRPLLAQAAAVMLMCAFLLKSAVFPFHFWQPDFHTTAPTAVGSLLSSVVVKVGVYGLIRMVTVLFVQEAAFIGQLLVILGVIGIFFGSLGALRTYDAKRMLAYSTFGQIGFILVAIGWNTPVALIGALVYAFNHAFIKSALLMLTGVVSSHTSPKTGKIAELSGLGKGMSLVSVLYLLGGLALTGIPPMNGFISKLTLVRGGIDATGWVALFLAVGAGLLTLQYMIGTWSHIFQKAPPEGKKTKPTGDSPLAPLLLISACVLLGIFAAPLIDWATQAVRDLGDPSLYIRAVLGS